MTQDELREIRKNINQLVRKSTPMNKIHLTHKEDLEIISIWNSDIREGKPVSDKKVPDDLFIMNTISLPDCQFELDERNCEVINGKIINFRICVFDENNRIPFEEDSHECFIVGTVESNFPPDSHEPVKGSIPIAIMPGSNGVFCASNLIAISEPNANGKFRLLDDVEMAIPNLRTRNPKEPNELAKVTLLSFARTCMDTWYGIQVCMMYPPTRAIFGTPKVIAEQNIRKTYGKVKKRPLLYVKNYYVNKDVLETLKNTDKSKGKKEWKTKVWYVAGHYRTLKDGRRIWVKPYLKGPLRNELTPDARDRIISTKGAILHNSTFDYKFTKAKEEASKANKAQPSREKSKSVNKKKPSIGD